MRIVAVVVVVVIALVAGAAACGGDGGADGDAEEFDDVFAAIRGLEGDARTRALLERSEREGKQLTWYTSASGELADAVTEAFGDAYGIDVAVYRASGETLLPRLLEEAEAGFRGADVAEMNGLGMFNLNDRGLLVPYRSPALRGVVAEAVSEGWTATAFYTFAATWNTDLVSDSERPRSWEDLAHDRFRGRVGIEAGDLDWYKTLRDHWVEEGKSPEEADALFARIGRNARVVRGHTFLAQFMAAGEVAVAPNYALRAQEFADDGAPIAWKPVVEPLIVQPNGIGLVERAAHPAAAVLFVDWLLSDGQELYAEGAGAEPVRRDLSLTAGTDRRVVDFASLAAEQQEWTDRFERLLALGDDVEEDG